MMTSQIKPQDVPLLGLPEGSESCEISIINTTCDITVPPTLLVEPAIEGHDWMNLPTYSFIIKHKRSGKQILFDLGARTDWYNHCPPVSDVLKDHVPGMRVQRDVVDILREGGVDAKDIDALVLSHWHFDHCGNIAVLTRTTALVVGPGFKDAFLPGWPINSASPFTEDIFLGRQVVEVPFTRNFRIGRFEAFDYFQDGSFYILNTPGHAVGHISALVRTTADTFIFLGGDVCHFGGSFRPTKYVPLPHHIPDETKLDPHIPRPCPCQAFTVCHPDQNTSRTSHFYKVATGGATWYADPALAQQSIGAMEEFDANPNVLVAIAHDPASLDVFTFFPNGTMNAWKKEGWKETLHWGFLNELPYLGKTSRPYLVDGLYKNGKRVKPLFYSQ
jgi:glyoxylase-like metal-dependent hydrolase (beta-lactamase superfamily II)